jgi:predicted phage baseplate assembly protein
VTVNSVKWEQVSNLSQAGATGHQYVSGADTQGRIAVTFGDGLHGARLPSGTNNISAKYRVGIGQSGNVDAQTITTLLSRPLGVSGVTNPIAATGGADPDPLEAIRRNAPVGLSALDRLVSLADYEDYARQFAGFAKASATRLAMDGRQIIHVTVAAQNDAPLTAATDSIIKLRDALLKYGDPHLAVIVAPRRLKAMLLQATIYLQADYSWDAVHSAVVDALTATFSFDNQEFGEPVFLSQVVATIQSVPGVDWVFMETLEGITEAMLSTPSEISTIPAKLKDGQPANRITAHLARRRGGAIEPAEVVHVLPAVPELILLKQGKP